MAQFRVEFVLDPATQKFSAELYHPDKADELIVRTEALYPTQAAAVLGVIDLFKNALLQFPRPAVVRKRGKPKAAKKAKKATKAKKAKRAPKRRKGK